MGVAPTTEDVSMAQDDQAEDGLPKAIVAQIDETYQILSAARKKRKTPAGYAPPAEVKSFTSKNSIPSLHSASHAGITALTVSRVNPSQFLTGGNDKIVQLYDRDTDKVLASLRGHTKKINHVTFREREGHPTLLLSASADKSARIWSHDASSEEYRPISTVKTHKGELTGLAVHPTSTIVAYASLDKTYSLYDLSTPSPIFRSSPSDDPLTSLAIHPDGTLLALGTPTSTIQIYDIRTGVMAASLTPPTNTPFTVNTLSFSENGYHLLSPSALSSVAVWDLRKQKTAHTHSLGETYKINKVLYDLSAQYLGVAGNGGVRVFAHKTWEELLKFDEVGDTSGIAFGLQAKEIWASSGREVKIWGISA